MFGGGFGGFGGGGGRARRKEVDNSKFYADLGVSKEAAPEEIKKAFRKAALQHHPDRGGNADKFKEINKAYEVLSDPQKRALYDEGGEEALTEGGGGGPGGMDIFDLFGGGFGGGGRRGPRVRRGEDVVFPLKVTLEDCYNGVAKKLRLTKNVICGDCNGKGGKGGDITCKDCRGQGVKMVIRQVGPGMIQQLQQQCGACKGSGSTMKEADKCKTCKGDKTTKEKKTLEIHVAKGSKHGEKITFSGEADQAPDVEAGDVVVVLQQSDHGVFRRDGANLHYKKTITLLEALTGFSFTIPHLDGRTLLVKSDPTMVVRPGDVKAIKDEGMPQKHNPYVRGSLYVDFDVVFPAELTEASKKVLKSVLPPPPADAGSDAMSDAQPEEVTLQTVDIEAEKRKFQQQEREERHAEAHDEDDEGAGGGRGQPQCRQQ